MKILSTISFIVLIELMFLAQNTLSQCIEYSSPFNRTEIRTVSCPMITTNDKRQTQPTTNNMFTIDFHCLVSDQVLCSKVKNVFITAGKFITATLDLKSPVSVNATFTNLCEMSGGCTADRKVLGAAGPARLIPNQDPTDNKVRLYPQALYKQLNLPQHPEYAQNDIMALFNSDMTYWFEGDPLPMLETQADMQYVVLHELIHGLGFVNSWNDQFGLQALTPVIGTTSGATGQFIETIFDRNLVLLPSGKQVTTITDELNQFKIDLSLSDTEIINSFMASPQFTIAKDMYTQGTTPNALGFLTTSNSQPNTQLTQDQIQNNVIILETSLNPYQPTSSIGHVDFNTYLNSSDFLMMFTYPKRETLGDMMYRAGSTNTTGPIGPKLRNLLGTIGYEVKTDYISPVTLSAAVGSNDNTSNTSSNDKKSDSSFVILNLTLSLVCTLLTFIYHI